MNNYSGILSLLIFCIELFLIINVFYFSKSKYKNLSLTILVLLALYQFFEFFICIMNLKWGLVVYLAFVTISFLPPTGLLLLMKVNKIEIKKFKGLIFAPAIFFIIYYLFNVNKFYVQKCSIIFASYSYPLEFLYGLFYYIPIAVALYIGIRNYFLTDDKKLKKQNLILVLGYLIFLVPTIITLLIHTDSINFIESLMCKFAFGLSLIISYFALDFNIKGIKK